ncbi:ABC transporter substrate-binding protein [Leucobacter allii]|uniref:Thiamine pyrimidine synthase n=1 Tax=Leucobacter allii TaxID=2932247 RepID=A0ABY4FPT6_9MICO|nr:ABC transporter substrate-binding protein [Leucobacter allii]UOQ58295.1 ABC transporter substrate-binding protein [Leucobacter allii]UOR02876.1 ABC transporter substrate-binding protein [Leucobacter allii]
MRRPNTARRTAGRVTTTALTAAALAAALGLAGCAPTDPAGADPAADPAGGSTVTFALDWAPNTNHIGVYVADALGYYADAGLDVEILPYGSTAATQLVSAGEADFGIGGQSSVQIARTAGLDLISVYRVTQHDTGRLVVAGDRDEFSRPAELDGATFGGFGSPLYTALATATIAGDGGAGEFTEVVLDTGAYEALAQGRIDFTLSVATWEGLQAELEGAPYRQFRYQDFGVPEQQSTGIVSSEAYVEGHPEEAAAFVQATARGYAYAAAHPDEAAELLIAANPDTLGTAQELVHRSAEMLAQDGYLVSEDRAIGAADPEAWAAFGAFLFDGGFLVDAEGKPLAEEPDWGAYYTDELLG